MLDQSKLLRTYAPTHPFLKVNPNPISAPTRVLDLTQRKVGASKPGFIPNARGRGKARGRVGSGQIRVAGLFAKSEAKRELSAQWSFPLFEAED